MNKKYISLYILFFITYSVFCQYYVTPSGSSSNNGLSELNAWSIEHAFNTAVAGDIVYIKSGLYFDNNITQQNNGTSVSPIKFIGYNNVINDIDPDAQVPYNLGTQTINVLDSFSYGDVVNSGVRWVGDYGKYSNIIVTECGDFNPNHFDSWTDPALNNYSGRGIDHHGNYAEVKNIYIENSGAQGFSLSGDYNTIDAVTVAADSNINACDYYFLLDESNNNTCTNIHVKRVGNIPHDGHGIVFKTASPCYNNTVTDFVIDNTNLELQFPGVHDNIVENGYVIRRENITTYIDACGLALANGSYSNTFNNIYLENSGIFYRDWDDGAIGGGDVNDASDNNIFNQITVNSGHSSIAFAYFDGNTDSSADNNTYYNCTFYGTNWQYERTRANSNSQFINCIWDNIGAFGTARGVNAPDYSVDATYSNNNFSNLGYNTPTGTNITEVNPLFTDANNGDFSLQNTSALKGVGIATPFLSAGNDIGAVQSTSAINVASIAVMPATLNLIIGENALLQASITPANASNQAVTWSSSNNSIATVDQNGNVTAIAVGNANIIATSSDGGFTASSLVNVIDVVCTSPSASTGIIPTQISVSTHDGNIPCNAMDNNINTRWSALGDGQWMQFDLGSQQNFNHLELAFYVGDTRSTIFDIQVSNDASTWTTVLSNQYSSGTSLALEDFYFSTQNARYIKYLGHGNTNSLWNSLTEVRIKCTLYS